MRMFPSVSGHSSELSIANHSPRSTVSQHHQPQKTKISTVIYVPLIQNSNQMASRLTVTTSFPRVFLQLLYFSRQRPSFSAHRAAPMTKTDLIFPAFSLIFVDFAVQFCFRCKFYSARSHTRFRLESGLTVARFFSTNHDSLLRIATNEIALF